MNQSIEGCSPQVQFPPTDHALSDPNGLLAIGGDLNCDTLVHAYSQGIFPWFSEGQDIHWWTPDPRLVLFPDKVHCSKSMKRLMNKCDWEIRINTSFIKVVEACAQSRAQQEGTWITRSMRMAYTQLHNKGYAHSVEVFDQSELIGGIYGICLGKVFFGESMFSLAPNTSKLALIGFCRWARNVGLELIDCQVSSNHLLSLGAEEITRFEFEQHLGRLISRNHLSSSMEHWQKASKKVLSPDGNLIS